MTVKRYKLVNRRFLTVAFILAWFLVHAGAAFLSIFVIGGYMFAISLLRTRVDGLLADERQALVIYLLTYVYFDRKSGGGS